MVAANEWTSVGGIQPDIVCYGDDPDVPVRIVEVIVTSPPTEEKRKKLETLKRRGVDVVEVTVTGEADLRRLVHRYDADSKAECSGEFPVHRFAMAPLRYRRGHHNNQRFEGSILGGGISLSDVVSAIALATPFERQALYDALCQLKELDALWPVPSEGHSP